MKKLIFIIFAAILALSTISCAQTQVYGQEAKSDMARNTSPNVSEPDMDTLVSGNNEFALALYQQLRAADAGNLFYSPYSISLALAMVYAGADGITQDQMSDVLNFILEEEDLHAAFNNLALELASRGEGAAGKDEEGFRLNIVNAIWGQVEYAFLSDYLDTLAENYGAGLRLLDYENDPEGSRQTINDWVSEQTEGRIEDLIKEGFISEATRLVLTNAIYFNAAWQFPFYKDSTVAGTFYLPDGSTVTVPMMHQTKKLGYASGNGYQAVELKYDGGELSMIVILPGNGNFEQFEASLNAQVLEGIIDNLRVTNLNLSMPKFEYESEFSLKDALEAMGMIDAFSDNADFSGMTGSKDLYIKDVVHKAFVSVDEAGTEAAAATGIIMDTVSMPLDPTNVDIDHSFIYLIQDNLTGTVLFLGCVVNPVA